MKSITNMVKLRKKEHHKLILLLHVVTVRNVYHMVVLRKCNSNVLMKKEINHGIIHLSKSKLALTWKVLKLDVGEGEGKQSPF